MTQLRKQSCQMQPLIVQRRGTQVQQIHLTCLHRGQPLSRNCRISCQKQILQSGHGGKYRKACVGKLRIFDSYIDHFLGTSQRLNLFVCQRVMLDMKSHQSRISANLLHHLHRQLGHEHHLVAIKNQFAVLPVDGTCPLGKRSKFFYHRSIILR